MRKESNTLVNLYGIRFIGSLLCYAVGELGTVIETSDGGATWDAFRTDYTNTFYDVHPLGYSNLFLIGGSDGFLNRFNRTDASWTEINNSNPEGINSMHFSGRRGWAAANKGAILRILTSPSGIFIQKQSTLSKNCVADIDFISDYTGVAVGDGETVWTTYNGGDSWICMRNYTYPRRPWFKLNVGDKKKIYK